MLAAYRRVYDRCGVASLKVRASGGIFTENISDEFHVETPSGEDTLLRCASCAIGFNLEVAPADHRCPTCSGALEQTKGIEVGNTFDLGTKYSDACGLAFVDAEGKRQSVHMGCYGIGVTRLVGAIVEANHDERGIVWPASVAPYAVHVVAIPAKDDAIASRVFDEAAAAVRALESAGMTVLSDDRTTASAGQRFSDADLIGIPWRVVVSERSLAAGGVELKSRSGGEAQVVATEAALRVIRESGSVEAT